LVFVGCRSSVILWHPAKPATGRPTGRLNRLDVEPEPLNRAHDERPQRGLVAQEWVGLDAVAGADERAIGIDLLTQRFNAIFGGADLSQDFNPADIVDVILALHPIPQCPPMGAERARWGNGGGFVGDDGKRWFSGRFRHGTP